MGIRYVDPVRHRDLRELVDSAASTYGSRTAYIELDPRGNEHAYTFSQVRDDVAAVGTALFDLGIAGRHVAMVAESCYSFLVCYLAVVNGGGVAVPLDKELTNDDLVELMRKGDVEALLYGDALHGEIDSILERCPDVGVGINISRYARESHKPGFDALIERGSALLAQGDTRFADVVIDPDAMMVIMFTSGTTGPNKGVMLSHHNITFVLWALASGGSDKLTRSLSVLPNHHIYETVHALGVLQMGFTLCYNDTILHLRDNLIRFKPDFAPFVPMIVEGMQKAILRETEKNNLTKALRFGLAYSNLLRKVGLDLRRTLFKPVLEHFGGNLKVMTCGAAPLRPDIIKWYDSLGIQIYNGYGLTECAPLVTLNSRQRNVPGSVGVPYRDIQMRISDVRPDGNGEIQVKGENVMLGYYKDPAATDRAFTHDGWLRTGDLGHIGRHGALFLAGRIKNLIILPNGKNVSPEELEEILQNNLPYVKELLVYETPDDGQGPRIAMTAFFEPEWLERTGRQRACAQLEEDVAKLNRRLTTYKRIQVIQVRDVEFEKTTTRKIKRDQPLKAVTTL